jgi:hypothetical protein
MHTREIKKYIKRKDDNGKRKWENNTHFYCAAEHTQIGAIALDLRARQCANAISLLDTAQ